jgi:CHAT domain-containing protein
LTSDEAAVAAALDAEYRGRLSMDKIRVLFLASDPFKTRALALDREVKSITAQIRSAAYRDSLELISAWAVSPDDLQQLLLQHRPHVVHFSGHGTADEASTHSQARATAPDRELVPEQGGQAAQLILMGDRGQPQPVSHEALVGLFDVLKDDIRLVVLNACHTKTQAEAISRVIDCCIGMNTAIGDEAAIAFSAALYRALGFGRDLQTAFKLAKNELQLKGLLQEQIPELHYRREAVNPAKVVLVDPR